MAHPRRTQCASCKRPHSDSDAFYQKGTYSDGVTKFRVYCKSCEKERNESPETRERILAQRERRRRESGIPRRGEKEYCVNGHLKEENNRPGRSDCAVCHREQEMARQRARGVEPVQLGENFPCGHIREGNTRMVKGKPKGCRQCHRERERDRPYNPETYRLYAQKNRQALNKYHRSWSVANRPRTAEFQRGGKDSMDYVQIIANDPCVFCGSDSKEIDHIVPVAKGGDGSWTNLAPICRTCNASKSAKDLLHFMMRRLEKVRDP